MFFTQYKLVSILLLLQEIVIFDEKINLLFQQPNTFKIKFFYLMQKQSRFMFYERQVICHFPFIHLDLFHFVDANVNVSLFKIIIKS